MVPSDDVVEFGGWPRLPRWVWPVAGVAVVAVLAGRKMIYRNSSVDPGLVAPARELANPPSEVVLLIGVRSLPSPGEDFPGDFRR